MNILDFRVRPRVPYFYKDLVPVPNPAIARYISLYKGEPRLGISSFEESIAEMKENGITQAVIFSGDAAGNTEVYDAVRKFPENYIGLAGARPDHGVMQAYRDLERAYTEMGLVGWNQSPFLTGVYASDRRNYPLYALSQEMGKCVVIHSSAHYNPNLPLDLGNPLEVDKVAVDFPDLRIVLTHGGVGFGDLGTTIANRHDNVWIDFTSLMPQWVPMHHLVLINGPLRHKAIFGTNWPCLHYNCAQEWKNVLKDKVQPLFFRENALRAMGLPV
ncbi:amidohydrolase family protein [bacterium]|nr:amidohydrolase family protein [bacterium]